MKFYYNCTNSSSTIITGIVLIHLFQVMRADFLGFIKGAGGGPDLWIFKIEFSIVLIEGSPSYQIRCTGSKNIDPLAKVITFSNIGFRGDYTARVICGKCKIWPRKS